MEIIIKDINLNHERVRDGNKEYLNFRTANVSYTVKTRFNSFDGKFEYYGSEDNLSIPTLKEEIEKDLKREFVGD
ncbi:hypothetical protein [Orenia marismortui]|uniref:hypothetical protein n=1 Tax=Orenia marismortui TaxID=46469 RepID=UPI00037EB8EC|nr:hypothetical protein [Orenia marismortui]